MVSCMYKSLALFNTVATNRFLCNGSPPRWFLPNWILLKLKPIILWTSPSEVKFLKSFEFPATDATESIAELLSIWDDVDGEAQFRSWLGTESLIDCMFHFWLFFIQDLLVVNNTGPYATKSHNWMRVSSSSSSTVVSIDCRDRRALFEYRPSPQILLYCHQCNQMWICDAAHTGIFLKKYAALLRKYTYICTTYFVMWSRSYASTKRHSCTFLQWAAIFCTVVELVSSIIITSYHLYVKLLLNQGLMLWIHSVYALLYYLCASYFSIWLFGAHSIQILWKAYCIQENCSKTGLLTKKYAF